MAPKARTKTAKARITFDTIKAKAGILDGELEAIEAFIANRDWESLQASLELIEDECVLIAMEARTLVSRLTREP